MEQGLLIVFSGSLVLAVFGLVVLAAARKT